jgi:pimeloyl-ACP methyl ester carboxylesterase
MWDEGHGISTANSFGVKNAGSIIENYITNLPDHKSVPNVVDIIGYSNGGNVAIWALEDLDPGSVRSVVRLGTPTYGDTGPGQIENSGTWVYNVYDPNDGVAFGVSKLAGATGGLPPTGSRWFNMQVNAPPHAAHPNTAQRLQKHVGGMNSVDVWNQFASEMGWRH